MSSPPTARGSSGRVYQIVRVLGEGGFGKVFLARVVGASGFEKLVAIKQIGQSSSAEDEEKAQRLRDEGRLLALLRHRAIVAVDDMVHLDGGPAVVMEYVDGEDLGHLIASGPLPLRVWAELVSEIGAALQAAHSATDPATGGPLHIVHRDIKPDNVRVTSQGDVKVLDFGIALSEMAARESRTRTNMALGTPGYMAPERMQGVDGPESDVYALGVVAWQALLGRRSPARPAGFARDSDLPDSVARAFPAVDEALLLRAVNLVRAMLAAEPEQRPTAATVLRDAKEIAAVAGGAWLAEWASEAVARARARRGEGDARAQGVAAAPVGGAAVDAAPPSPARAALSAGRASTWTAVALVGGTVGALLIALLVALALLVWMRRGSSSLEVQPVVAGPAVPAAEPAPTSASAALPSPTSPARDPAGMPAAGEPTGHETPRGGADLTSRAASASQGAGTDARAGGASGAQATQPVAAPTSPPVQEAPNGVVRLEGQGVKGAQLVGTSTLTLARRRAEALGSDEVPPGTYTLVVEFTDGTRITRTNLLEVVADQTTTVRCSLAQYQCVIGEP